MSELVSASLNSPEDILVLKSPQDVESLCQSCQLFWVALLTSFTEIMLIMRHKLFNVNLCLLLVDTIVSRSARGKGEERINEHFTSISRFYAIWEQIASSFD